MVSSAKIWFLTYKKNIKYNRCPLSGLKKRSQVVYDIMKMVHLIVSLYVIGKQEGRRGKHKNTHIMGHLLGLDENCSLSL